MTPPHPYLTANPGWHSHDAPAKAREIDQLLIDLGWRPQRVLDVGCGTGAVLAALGRRLARRGQAPELEGWDPDPTPLALAPSGVTVRCGDALRDAAPADLLLGVDVLEHTKDPAAWLRAGALRAERMILRVPIEASLRDRLRPAATRAQRERYGHLHAWTTPGVLALLRDAGLQAAACRVVLAPTLQPSLRTFVAEATREQVFARWPAAVDLLGGGSILLAASASDR